MNYNRNKLLREDKCISHKHMPVVYALTVVCFKFCNISEYKKRRKRF